MGNWRHSEYLSLLYCAAAPQLWEQNQQGQEEGAGPGVVTAGSREEIQCSRIPTEVLAYLQLSDSPPKGRGHSADTHAEKQIAISLYTPSFRAHLHHGEALLHSLPPC